MSKRSTFELDEKSATCKDERLEDSANLAGLSSLPGFPRHTRNLGASRRKVAALAALTSTSFGQRVSRSKTAPAEPEARDRRPEVRRIEDPEAVLAQLKLARCPHLLTASFAATPVRQRTVDHSHCPVLAPATLAALLSTRTIPDRTCSMSLIPFAPFAEIASDLKRD